MRRSPDDFEGQLRRLHREPGLVPRWAPSLPVEGDRWQVTLAGVHGDVPPATDEGIAALRGDPADARRSAQLIERCERLSDIATYRFPSSQRRHYEKVRDLLAGLVTLGDASSSFDPIYGQGMTSSALQAAALGDVAARTGIASDELPKRFHRKAARIIEAPWRIAVGGDFGHPRDRRAAAARDGAAQRLHRARHPRGSRVGARRAVLQPGAPARGPADGARSLRRRRCGCCARRGRSPVVTGAAVRHPRVGSGRGSGSA